MKKIPCLYAVVRFCPFVETEEFANVGIVIIAPQHGIFDFKLMTKKHARVTDFFEQLDAPVFKGAMQNLKEEFDRIGKILKTRGFGTRPENNDAEFARALFNEIVRPREAVIKFSNIRGVLLIDAKTKLKELYGHYVERDFVTPEYREQVLERTLRKWFYEAGLGGRFERLEVGTEEYHATFPFVEQQDGKMLTAIKPLNLGQAQPSKILDHGGAWVWKLAQLRRKKTLPDRVLITVEGPGMSDTVAKIRAFDDVVAELKEVGAEVLTYERKADIIKFVSAH